MWFHCSSCVSQDDGTCILRRANSHKVLLEEFLQLSLSGRVREVSDVESPPLSGASDDSLILGCVDGLVAASADASALGSAGGLGEGGVGHLGSSRVNGHGVEVGIDDTKCTVVLSSVGSTSGVKYFVWELRNCGCPDFALGGTG